jgi:hypothetical protein
MTLAANRLVSAFTQSTAATCARPQRTAEATGLVASRQTFVRRCHGGWARLPPDAGPEPRGATALRRSSIR